MVDSTAGYVPDGAYDDHVVTEVIRPAAIVPEGAARAILVELALSNVAGDGQWLAEPSRWNRYDRPWVTADDPGSALLMGTIQVAYGTPTKYEITIYRVSITHEGAAQGWTVQKLTDEALGYGDLSLMQCPRAVLNPPPRPVRW